MQHADQHIEAIARTVRVKDEVEATVFSDNVKEMGRVHISKGKITITLDFVPGMVTSDARRDFIIDAIGLALRACFDARPSTFDPHAVD